MNTFLKPEITGLHLAKCIDGSVRGYLGSRYLTDIPFCLSTSSSEVRYSPRALTRLSKADLPDSISEHELVVAKTSF